MCVFLLVTETHISATTKQPGYVGAPLIAPFLSPHPTTYTQYIYHPNGTKAAQPDPAESLQQTPPEHTVNTTVQTCSQSLFNSALTQQREDTSHLVTQISVFNTCFTSCACADTCNCHEKSEFPQREAA